MQGRRGVSQSAAGVVQSGHARRCAALHGRLAQGLDGDDAGMVTEAIEIALFYEARLDVVHAKGQW